MDKYEHVVIVGVGLLGGSIGMGLRARGLAKRVTGCGRSPQKLESAVELGAIDDYQTDLARACRSADLAIVCTPVQQVVEIALECMQAMPGGLVTDVGSTKATICQDVDAAQTGQAAFCGSHPLAGSDKSGVEFARADLLVDRLTILTPSPNTTESTLAQTARFWQSLGSRTRTLAPQEHDAAIASTSHVPHIVAAAVAASTPAELLSLAASGWCDTTRIAAGSTDMWRQIICENMGPVTESLKSFSREIQTWLSALEAGDVKKIQKLLDAGKQNRDSVGN